MFSFIKLLTAIFHSQQLQQPTKPESPEALSTSYILYESLDELSLYAFIKCLVHQDLSYLIKSGNPPVQELAANWSKLFGDFIDLNNDNETRYLALLQRDIVLDGHILGVENDLAMYLLEGCPIEEKVRLCENIEFRGFFLKVTYDSPEEFERDYNRIIGKIAPVKLRSQSKIAEYNRYMESKKDNSIDESYFDATLIRLWKHYKILFKSREITVSEFVALTKEYLKDLETMKKELDQYKKPQSPF